MESYGMVWHGMVWYGGLRWRSRLLDTSVYICMDVWMDVWIFT